MREDLLDVYASIDWAIAQIDIFENRLAAWLKSSPYQGTFEKNPETGQEALKVGTAKPNPRTLNVDAGMIVHATRSSLDHLAVKLAERNGATGVKDVYFPVCDTAGRWTQPKHGGLEKIKRLSNADQIAIEQFQPYHGRDNDRLLSALHHLDSARKHRELLKFKSIFPGMGYFRKDAFPPDVVEGMMREAPKDGYSLVAMPSDPDYQVHVRTEVTLDEPLLVNVEPAAETLRRFIGVAYRIIDIFDK